MKTTSRPKGELFNRVTRSRFLWAFIKLIIIIQKLLRRFRLLHLTKIPINCKTSNKACRIPRWTNKWKKVFKRTMRITTKSKQREPSTPLTREIKNYREFCNKIITHLIASLSSLRILP